MTEKSPDAWIATRERHPMNGQEVAVRTLFGIETRATFSTMLSPHWAKPHFDNPEAFPYWRPLQ
jgi:hypothetical protein